MVKEQADTVPPPSKQVKGWFRVQEQLVSGWAVDPSEPDRRLEVEIFVAGQSLGFARADRFDDLLQSQIGGDGMHAFAFYLPTALVGPLEGEALVKERLSGVELQTKRSTLIKSDRAPLQLSLDKVALGRIDGRADGYPGSDKTTLEFWTGGRRVSEIPLTWRSKREGRFSAQLTADAARSLLVGAVQVALPGLHEAGLSVPVAFSLTAFVTRSGDDLSVDVSGEHSETHQVDLALEFVNESTPPSVVHLNAVAGKASCRWPEDMPSAGTSVRVLVSGVPIPTKLNRDLPLRDPIFSSLGNGKSIWQVSDGFGERAHFAFPTELANELRLSGDFAHLWRASSETGIVVSQLLPGSLTVGDEVCRRSMLRATNGAKVTFRLVDEDGVLAEESCFGRGEHRWVPFSFKAEPSRPSVGGIKFEVDAGDSDELELAFENSIVEHPDIAPPVNLLVNDKMTEWPFGAGPLRHTVRGEICRGWRVFNRKCAEPVLSSAIMDPHDGSIGLALAAPKIDLYLRLEADLAGCEVARGATGLSFRAGIPPSARRLLSQSAELTPQFALIDRIYVLRRTRAIAADSFIERDEIVCNVARNVPVCGDMERHWFKVPSCEMIAPEWVDLTNGPSEPEQTYHLIFEFRHPTVVALQDVEVVQTSRSDDVEEIPNLQLEDRNIRLQVPSLKTIGHWLSSAPVSAIANSPKSPRAPLKWSTEISGELVEIVIPVFNALEETKACLEALSRASGVPILVHLVDDGSDASARAALEAYSADKPWIQIHGLNRNRGYTFAADFGLRKTRSNWVVLLNSDTVVTDGWLEGMLRCARSDPNIGFVGPLSNAATYQSVPCVYDAAGNFKVNKLPMGMTPNDMADLVRKVSTRTFPEAPLLNGFCTLMKRTVFLELGGLNSGAFPAGYGEENDLCLRARKAGVRLAIADDVYVFHHKSASFGHARRTELSKKGGAALRKLHPDVDIKELTAWFREIPSLVGLRAELLRHITRHSADPASPEAKPNSQVNDPQPSELRSLIAA